MFLHLADAWEAIADAVPDAPALVHGRQVRTWREFDERASRLAAGLAASGAGEGTTVAIDLYNSSEYLETLFAALKVRAAPANVNYRYFGDELQQLLTQAQAGVLVYHASLADRVRPALKGLQELQTLIEVDDSESTDARAGAVPGANGYEDMIAAHTPRPRQYRAGDDCLLAFTGGTTGLPKGVMFRLDLTVQSGMGFRALLFGLDIAPDADPVALARELQVAGQLPVAIPASPLMHSTGLLYASIPAMLAGGSVVTLTKRSFDADELFETVQRTGATTIAIVGDAFARPMLRSLEARAATGSPYDLSSLRSVCSAGVAWSAEVKQALLGYLPETAVLSDSCGSTEGAFYGNRIVRRGESAFTANFVARAGVKIVDADRRELAPGELGYIASPTPATGYFRDPEASDRVFYVDGGLEYVVPGDFGRIEPDGTITLLGRGSSTINTGGEKVFPEEVEDVIRRLPGVDDCLVFGLPDERFGERVCALVQPAVGVPLDTAAVVAAVRTRLAGYKVPRHVVVDSVPRLPNGKADFPAAKQRAATGIARLRGGSPR